MRRARRFARLLSRDGYGGPIAIGLAHLEFYRSIRGQWLITRWQDVRDVAHVNSFDPEQKSLGLLRLETQ